MENRSFIVLISVIVFLTACKNNKYEYDASGVFETTEVLVSAETAGKIMAFDIEEGKRIDAEIPIGYIDTIQLHLKKMQLSASKGASKSRQTNIPNQISALQQQISTQKKEKVRFTNLVAANAANQKQLDDINASILVLEKQLSAQIELLNNTNKGVMEESSSIEIQIAQLKDQINKSIIKSPIKGTVLSKYAEKGELAETGKVLFKIADTDVMFLRAYLISNQLTQIKLGQEVKVYADFGDKTSKEYAGVITWISSKAEFTPKTIQTKDERENLVYAIKIAVKNDGYLKQGMYGEVALLQKSEEK